jgi:hypothetical protein
MVTLRSLSPVALLVCLALAGSLPAQSPSRPHRFQEFPAAEPLRIFDAALGDPGAIWVAAEQGVFRFDGVRYHRLASYPFARASFVSAAVGHVWAGGAAGLAHFANGQWQVIHRHPVTAWQRTPAGFWAVSESKLELRAARGETLATHPAPSPETLVALHRDRLWFLRAQQLCSVPAGGPGALSCQVLSAVDDGARPSALRDDNRLLSLSSGDPVRSQLLARLVPHRQSRGFLAGPLFSPAGRAWWIQPEAPPAAVPSWTAQPMSDSCELFVDEFSRWICADNRLALSRRDESWEVWTDRTAPGAKAFFAASHSGRPAAGPMLSFGRNGLSRLDPSSRQWVRLPNLPLLDVRAVLDDGFGGYWLATMQRGLLRVDATGTPREQFHPCRSIDTYRLLVRDSAGRIWVGGKDPGCFFELRGRPGAWSFLPQTLPGNNLQAVALAEDPDHQLWMGYEVGILRQNAQGQWQPVRTSSPVDLIRDLVFASRDVLWVAHRVSGSFTRLERDGDLWRAVPFDTNSYPGDTYFLRRDSRGWVWRGADDAVWVSRPGRTKPEDWLRLDRRSGVPLGSPNLGGFWEDSAGFVWLAGVEGVLRLKPDPSWFQAPSAAPILARAAILGQDPGQDPGQEWFGPDSIPREFPAGVARIAFEWSTLAASPFRPTPVQFRWSPGAPWQPAPDARVVLNQPGEGNYTLEAAFTGDGQPPVAVFTFRIAPAAAPWRGWLLPAGAVTVPLLWFGWQRREWLRYRLGKLVYLAKARGDILLPTARSLTGQLLLCRYQVDELHAHGGFANIYRARDTQNPNVPIALKVLDRTSSEGDEPRRRFAQEVAALSSLEHPHIPPLLDSFVTPSGEPVLVLPFYPGPSLRDLLRHQTPLAPARVALLASQIGHALLTLHRKGLVHRDIKPDNILFRDAAHAMLIDFGAATSRGAVGQVEQTGTITGSLHYLAPERLLGQFSPASDLFALAVVLLECLTGLRPAQLPVAPQDPGFPASVARWIDSSTAQTLMEALRHQPDRRPADWEPWLDRLVTLLEAANSSR